MRLRPDLILLEHIVRFKLQVIESLKDSKMGGAYDYHFIIHFIVLLSQRCVYPIGKRRGK
jgi:hypothetical protein